MTLATEHPLAGCTLFVSARSPFARRVRVALLETGLPSQERAEDVLAPTDELIAVNPLARVPTLVTTAGEVMVESGLILQHLWEGLGGAASPLRPADAASRRRADLLSGLAVGLNDKSVEHYFERLRPAPHQDPALLQEVRGCVERTLRTFERALDGREHLVGDGLTFADLDVSIALTYLDLRVDRTWKARLPALAALQARAEARESMRRTAPPPPPT